MKMKLTEIFKRKKTPATTYDRRRELELSKQKHDAAREYLDKLRLPEPRPESAAQRMEMFMQYIAPAIDAMAERAVRMQDELNELNVFPMPDRDTGDNIAALMSTLQKTVDDAQFPFTPVEKLWEAVARGLLLGARGNSGVYLMAIFGGMQKVLAVAEEFDAETLALAARVAEAEAHAAADDFVEGSIVHVVSTLRMTLTARSSQDLNELADTVILRCEQAVEQTPELNPKLGGRIDSGAKGLTELLKAAIEAVREASKEPYRLEPIKRLSRREIHAHELADWHEGDPRYCVTMRSAQAVDQVALKRELQRLGREVKVAGNATGTLAHVHVDLPNLAIETACKFARDFRENVQISDMMMQVKAYAERTGGETYS